MTKNEFLLKLSEQLSVLEQDDINKSLDYYSEIIDDRIEDGISEEEAVEMLGSPDEIALQILLNTPITKQPKITENTVKYKHEFKAIEIVLIILGFPLWFPLLITAFSLVLTVYILIWTAVIVLYSIVLSFVAVAFAGFVKFVVMLVTGKIIKSFVFLGIGIAFVGITILSILAVNFIAKIIVKFSIWIFKLIKSWFCKKKGAINEN